MKRKIATDENGQIIKKEKTKVAISLDDVDITTTRTVRDTTKVKTNHADIARNSKAEQERVNPRKTHKRIRPQFQQKELLTEALATEVSKAALRQPHALITYWCRSLTTSGW